MGMTTYADLPQDRIWESYNLTKEADGITNVGQEDYLCEFHLECVPDTQPTGVHLGNFNYNRENRCVNAAAHVGHGSATGCSTNTTCSNAITFSHDQGHNGLLEYFQWEPVSVINAPSCALVPEHHNEDYTWNTPSPWDTQENFNPTPQNPEDNENYSNSL